MSYLSQAIQEDILAGCATFAEIARKHEVPLSWVDEVAGQMIEDGFPYEPTEEERLQFDMGKDLYYLDSDCHLEYLD